MPLAVGVCCVLGQNTLFLQRLSPPRWGGSFISSFILTKIVVHGSPFDYSINYLAEFIGALHNVQTIKERKTVLSIL